MKSIKRFWLFLGITSFILILYGFSFQSMGIDSDFFGVLQDIRLTKSWHTFWKSGIATTYYPLNEVQNDTTFFTFYRPLVQHLHALESYLFGDWWFGYNLGAIFFFSMTAGLLGLIFSYFYTTYNAIILAFLWATHPALSPSLLSVTVLLSAAYFFIALSALCYIWFFKNKGFYFYLGSLICYAAGALSYDLLIIAPMPLFFFLLFFYRARLQEIIPYFCVTSLCIGLRVYMMGGLSHTKNSFSLISFLKMSVDNLIQTLRPFWGLQQSSTMITLMITSIFSCWIVFNFIQNKKDRLFITWLLFSFGIGSWGIIIGNSSSRYCTLGLPFFVLLLYWLMHQSFSKKTATCFLLFLISIGGIRTYNNFSMREQYTHARDTAMYELLNTYPSEQYLFLTAPHFCNHEIFLLSSGLMQGLQLFSNNDNLHVYHLIDTPLCTMEYPSQGTIKTTTIKNGYRLTATDPKKIWFMTPHHAQNIQSSMGTILINERTSSWQANDISIILDKKYRTKEWLQETRIFSWDPHTWKFIPLQKDHLLKKGKR